MPFEKEPVHTPTSIGVITVEVIQDSTKMPPSSINVRVQVIDQDGVVIGAQERDLWKELIKTHQDNLIALFQDIRTQAESEIL